MNWIVDISLLLLFIIGVIVWIFYQRKRLIKLWNEVTRDEVDFYRELEKVVQLFYTQLSDLRTDDNKTFINIIRRYRKKRIRTLLLKVRQDLYNAVNIVYDDVLESDKPAYQVIIDSYEKLQKIRRLYNSKVLLYNQTISVFPTRYVALRMKLELKEYFG